VLDWNSALESVRSPGVRDPGTIPGSRRGPVSLGEYGVRMDDDPILALVKRLARPHASGGAVIERAAILAEGADFASVMAWIADHDGQPEASVAAGSTHGLHGARFKNSGTEQRTTPLRYVLPAGTLT
jgi:hypothetical protein